MTDRRHSRERRRLLDGRRHGSSCVLNNVEMGSDRHVDLQFIGLLKKCTGTNMLFKIDDY